MMKIENVNTLVKFTYNRLTLSQTTTPNPSLEKEEGMRPIDTY